MSILGDAGGDGVTGEGCEAEGWGGTPRTIGAAKVWRSSNLATLRCIALLFRTITNPNEVSATSNNACDRSHLKMLITLCIAQSQYC